MLTLNTILEDIKKVPVNQLEELHTFILKLISKNKAVSGAVISEDQEPYNSEFVEKIKKAREEIKSGETERVDLEDLLK